MPEGPIVYSELAEDALDAPRAAVRAFLDEKFERFSQELCEVLIEQLRQAYTAGVADGFRDAVIRQEEA